jgi:hypothetical protein
MRLMLANKIRTKGIPPHEKITRFKTSLIGYRRYKLISNQKAHVLMPFNAFCFVIKKCNLIHNLLTKVMQSLIAYQMV